VKTADPGAAPSVPAAPTGRVALITLSVAQLMFLLDATIVNVALPSIQESMRLSGPALEWVVTGYSLPFGGLLLLGGRAGDILGRRRVFLGGLVLFTAASLLGGLAVTSWWLLACRAAQGVGAAAAYPATLALITATFPDGPARHRALGTFNAIAGAGGSIGLLAGGVITTYLSWRWVMFVNVPIGLFIIAAAPRVLPETGRRAGRFDLAGALTVTTGLTLAVYGLITGATDETGRSHWADPGVLASLGAAVVLLIAFVAVERRSQRPLVPLGIFADRSRSGTYIVSVLLNTAMFGIYFFLTLFLQRVWGYSPLRTAVVYIPMSILLVGTSWAGARIVGRIGVRALILIGLAIAVAGMAWMARIGDSSGFATGLLVPAILTYGGIGLTTVPLTLAAVARVAAADSGLASGLFSSARQMGGATGLAVLGTVTWTTVADTARAARHPGGALVPGLPFTTHALITGIERGFAVAAGITALAWLAAVIANPSSGSGEQPAAAPATPGAVAQSEG
jgi:EmrB/QacA subfamily drug resistance transporter